MSRLSIYGYVLIYFVFMVTSQQIASQVLSESQQQHIDFFYRNENRGNAVKNQTATQRPETSTTSTPQATTQKEFTGIAFPPQVFQILTGNEPTEEHLGGRKNTSSSTANNSTEHHVQQSAPTAENNSDSNTNKFPTRFPPGNKPPYIRPTQKPISTGVYYLENWNQNYKPQPGSIAAAPSNQMPSPTTNVPDNRFGATTKKPPPTTSARPTPPRPTSSRPKTTTKRATTGQPALQGASPQISGSMETKPSNLRKMEVVRSIRSVQEYLQNILTTSSNGVSLWDGTSGNFLVSPLSVGLTMAQMMMAGGPRAKSHLRSVFKLNSNLDSTEQVLQEVSFHKSLGELVHSMQRDAVKENNSWNRAVSPDDPYSLITDTAVFAQKGLSVRPTFVHSIQTLYNSRMTPVDFRGDPFGSVSTINRWANEASRGKIKNFLSVPPSTNTAALFASSLYFKATWRNTFSEEYTEPGEFSVSADEKITVSYMIGEVSNGSKYIDSAKYGVKALRLAYNETDDVAMYMILPKNENSSIEDLAKRLLKPSVKTVLSQRLDSNNFPPNKNFQDPLPPSWLVHKQQVTGELTTRVELPSMGDRWELDEIISEMKEKAVAVTIPKLYLRGSLRLSPPGIGVKDQLSGMLEDPAQAVGATTTGAIIHETVLEITESGTEAAAITGGFVDYLGGEGTFRADRPFMVLLRHETTGIPLFWGAVVRPSSTVARQT